MNKKKNTSAKIVAFIALLAIIIGIIGTGVLVIVSSFSEPQYETSEVDIEQYLESLSWSTVIESDGIEVDTTKISAEEIANENLDQATLDQTPQQQEDTSDPDEVVEVELEADIEISSDPIIESDADVIETLLPSDSIEE